MSVRSDAHQYMFRGIVRLVEQGVAYSSPSHLLSFRQAYWIRLLLTWLIVSAVGYCLLPERLRYILRLAKVVTFVISRQRGLVGVPLSSS